MLAVLTMGLAGPTLVGAPRIQAPGAARASDVSAASVRTMLDRYCVACHNPKLRTGNLTLDAVDPADVGSNPDVWEKVLRKLSLGIMPPTGRPRPDLDTYTAVTTWLETALDRAAAAHGPQPGRTASFHRLNRAEYANAVRDLLGLDVKVTDLLPLEPAVAGFDNIAESLSLSPSLMERFLSVARKVSQLAVGAGANVPVIETFRISGGVAQNGAVIDDLPLGSAGGMIVRHYFPADGEYQITVRLKRGAQEYIVGLEHPHALDVWLNGMRIKQFTIGGEDRGTPSPAEFFGNILGDSAWEEYSHTADDTLTVRVEVKAGSHLVGASFVHAQVVPDGMWLKRRVRKGSTDVDATVTQPSVASVVIGGPYGRALAGATPSRRKVFVCQPARAADEEPCARTILAALARQAYRRPVTPMDTETLLGLYRTGRKQGQNFEAGIQLAVERILVAPDFLFRVERDPAGVAANTAYALSDLELASRLAFFLWSSLPDEELLRAAETRRLGQPAVLGQQVRRMLTDTRAKALAENFFGQWLDLRSLPQLRPDPQAFPEFTDDLRRDVQQETALFLNYVWREDRSVLDLITANYSFLNERLARHYGVPNVYGEAFRKVTLPDDRRSGILGHGSVLMATSYPNRTSPVLRGKWLLANLLASPPPPPPPNVPGLKEKGENGQPASVRERLELHRKNPACANCHALMDPLGFALENFDATGAWRTDDAGQPIDASATTLDGRTFEGPAGLRAMLVSRKKQFVEALTEKLLTYALGRGMQTADMPAIRQIVRDAAAHDYRWSSLVAGVATSAPFRMRTAAPAEADPRQKVSRH